MQHVLYAPGLGYYSAGSCKFGREGDFVTAPEIGSLFAKCMAAQFHEILQHMQAATILELGAGSGQFASDVIQELAKQNILLDKYYILELSADLRTRQQEKILQNCAEFAHIVRWIDHLPSNINGIIFANEVMDAMPIAKFNYANDTLQEYFVTLMDDKFCYTLQDPSSKLQEEFARNQIANLISQPYASEINLYLRPWLTSLNECLSNGLILLCDYGFPRHEYYHPQRNEGTFMCHYRHQCHSDPFCNIGLQDLTAHVDFTSVAEAAIDNNLEIAGYTTLTHFLLNCGICDVRAGNLPVQDGIQQAHEINTLTSPAEMGELFKCIALVRGVDISLRGFSQFDKTHCL